MGSFNVACSISNISLGPSDKVVFIPLVVRHYNLGKRFRTLQIPSQYVIYPDDFFAPLCLPIHGKYNDYGGIEDVIKDDNTKAIENFLGIDVEDLVSCIQRKGVYDVFSKMSEKFLSAFKLLSNYKTPVDEKLFNALGFIKLSEDNETTTYEYGDQILPYFITVTPYKICIIDVLGTVKYEMSFEKRKLDTFSFDDVLKIFSDLSNYYVGVPKEKQDIVNLIMHMSGMFVHADIYATLTMKKYGESYGRQYEEYLDTFINVLKEGINTAHMSKEEKAIQKWKEIEVTPFISDWHRNWYKFRDIFVETLREGKLREDFIKYSIFSYNMYSMNRFYFPAMNGEQCGNDKASLILAEKTVEILKNNIKEYDDLIDEEDI